MILPTIDGEIITCSYTKRIQSIPLFHLHSIGISTDIYRYWNIYIEHNKRPFVFVCLFDLIIIKQTNNAIWMKKGLAAGPGLRYNLKSTRVNWMRWLSWIRLERSTVMSL